MPTYAQLALEPVWRAQFTSNAMETQALIPLREFYGLGPASIGAAGDNNHLYGRHRSYNWDVGSIYCTNRAYGTTAGRDQGGDRDQYRAFDTGIQGQALYDASRRMDALVRSGAAPGVAEWFGTFDGQTVVGWFEGHPSSSDDSHLFHLHVGVWNDSADDPALMRLLYQTITGKGDDDDMGASFGPIELLAETTSLCIPPVAAGAADPRETWINVCNDTFGQEYSLRMFASKGDGSWQPVSGSGVVRIHSGIRLSVQLAAGVAVVSVQRMGIDGGEPYAGPLTVCFERGPVVR